MKRRVIAGPDSNGRQQAGIILRSQLIVLLSHRTFCGPDGLDASTSLPTVDDFATTLESAGKALSAVSLDEADMERFVDLRPFMNPWPFTVVRW